MRCYICDNELSENEIQLDENLKSEPCTSCMKVIMDTAYTDGFEPKDPEEHPHIHLLEGTVDDEE